MFKNPPTKNEICKMQKFYNEGNSVAKVAKKFGWRRNTLFKYLETRKPKHISEEEFKRRRTQLVIDHRRRKKLKLIEYKGGKCKYCGYNRCISSLDFHHRNPKEKSFGINECMCYSYERILKEVDKCDLVCRNCHGEINEGLILGV
jgi:predicted Zn-ribbon and HTH transcriptional regulator